MPTIPTADVAAALEQQMADVLTQARERHAAALADYRSGLRRMNAAGGSLPPDELARLLDVCRELGIMPERLSADAVNLLRHDRQTAAIEAIHQRNVSRREPLPKLQGDVDAATQQWLEVKTRCEQEMRKAEAELNTCLRALEQVASVRDERADEQYAERRLLEDSAPHLYRDVEPDHLRRILQPDGRRSLT